MTMIRVASFNIRNGIAFDGWNSWPFRWRATAAAVASLDVDVVALQEVHRFQERSLLRRLPRYAAVGRARGAHGRGERVSVLLERARCQLVSVDHRWFGDEPHLAGSKLPGARAPRMATIVVVEVEGIAVQVINTHLDEASAGRRTASVEQLVEWLDPSLPRLVLGDLNARPDDPELAPLYEAGLRQALPAEAGGTSHRFTGCTDGRRIDHILVSSDIEVLDAGVLHLRPDGKLASDHWPVAATLRSV